MRPEQYHINDHDTLSLKQKCPRCTILTRVLDVTMTQYILELFMKLDMKLQIH